MRKLEEFVNEKLKVSKIETKYKPKTKEELVDLIIKEIETNGPNCSLNHIDVSNITDMSYLFRGGDPNKYQMGHSILSEFDGDISDWNVSNVTNMAFLFYRSRFDGKKGDISNWDVSNVINMDNMFYNSKFNGDISTWQINPKAKGNMNSMFVQSPLENNPPAWYK